MIRHARAASDLKANAIAEEMAITPQYLSAIENGKPTLFGTRLFRVLCRLGITITLTYEPLRRGENDG